MALPILQNIADVIKTRLENITVDNGYEFETSGVKFVTKDQDTWNPAPRYIMIDQGPQVKNELSSHPGNPPAAAYDVQFKIHGFCNALDTPKDEIGIPDDGTTENQMIAAIWKAIANSDAASWHTFGGNAINASLVDGDPIEAEGHEAVTVQLDVLYRVSETDPYTVRA